MARGANGAPHGEEPGEHCPDGAHLIGHHCAAPSGPHPTGKHQEKGGGRCDHPVPRPCRHEPPRLMDTSSHGQRIVNVGTQRTWCVEEGNSNGGDVTATLWLTWRRGS